jgi:hypothetical protein
MSRGLGRGVIPQYHPLITASTRPLLRSLLASSGGDFVPAIRRYAGGLNLSVVYGLEATRDDDPALLKAEGATNLLANKITAGGGLWAVDILPCRPCLVTAASTYPSADRTHTLVRYLPAWFPGTSFLRKAAAWKETIVDSVDFPFSLLKARMVLLRGILYIYVQLSNEVLPLRTLAQHLPPSVPLYYRNQTRRWQLVPSRNLTLSGPRIQCMLQAWIP